MAPAGGLGVVSGLDSPHLGLTAALVSLALMALVFFSRERRLAALRRKIAVIHALSEQILSARNPVEILDKLETELGPVLGCTRVLFYVHQREAGMLEPVTRAAAARVAALSLAAPDDAKTPPALRCFRAADPLSQNDPGPPARGVRCFPMFAQTDLTGVLQIEYDRAVRGHTADESAALHHLANQAAIALKLMDQQLLREQILRGEKLGAAGELISGVAQELRAPLEMLSERAHRVLARVADPGLAGEVRALAEETEKASAALERLVSFSRGDQNRAMPLSVNRLLADLLAFRAQQWKLKSISAAPALAEEDLVVVGARGQLEQALLSLLLHAEHSVSRAGERRIGVSTRARAGRVVIEIDYSAPPLAETESEAGALSLAVCRGVFENHGGSMQQRPSEQRSIVVVDLPLAQASAAVARGPARSRRTLTAILVEPDGLAQRHVLGLLAARGHRVIPAQNGTEALEYIQRVKFDLLLCSTRMADLAWAELVERSRRYVGTSVVLTEGPEHLSGLPDQPVLSKPVDEARLDQLLDEVTGRTASPSQ